MSTFRDKVKQLIAQQIGSSSQASASQYRISVVSSINSDGTCVALLDGNGVVATPLYPVVKGMEVMLVISGTGKVSAIPTKPNTPQVDIIHPPYFTGGKLRFGVGLSVDGGSLSTLPTFLFQDQFNSNIYFFQATDDPNLLDSKLAFSPNGQFFVTLSANSANGNLITSKVYKLGGSLTSNGTINQAQKLFSINPKLLATYTLTISKPFDGSNPFVSIEDFAVDNDMNVYWLISKTTTDTIFQSCSSMGATVTVSKLIDALPDPPGAGVFVQQLGPTDPRTITSAGITTAGLIVDIIQPHSPNQPGGDSLRYTGGVGRGCFTGILTTHISDGSIFQEGVNLAVGNHPIIEFDLYKNGSVQSTFVVNPTGGAIAKWQSVTGEAESANVFVDPTRRLVHLIDVSGTPFSVIADISSGTVLFQTSTNFNIGNLIDAKVLHSITRITVPGFAISSGDTQFIAATVDTKKPPGVPTAFKIWDDDDTGNTFGIVYFNGTSGALWDVSSYNASTAAERVYPLKVPDTTKNIVHVGKPLTNISPGQADTGAPRKYPFPSFSTISGRFAMARME